MLHLVNGMFPFETKFQGHAQSDNKGRFTFADREPSNWLLTVVAPGLAPEVVYIDLRNAKPTVFPDHHDATDTYPVDLMIELDRCHVFATGKVRDASAGIIAGARVGISMRGGVGGVVVETELDGSYSLCVPSRPYTWDTGSGLTWNQKMLTIEADGYGRVEIDITETESFVRDIVLDAQTTVTGRIVAAQTGKPIAGARVQLEPPMAFHRKVGIHPGSAQIITDEAGIFHIAGLTADVYRVGAQHTDFVGWETRPVDLRDARGEHRNLGDFILFPSAVVEGVARLGGAPIKSGTISFSAIAPDGSRIPDGYYSATNVFGNGQFRARVRMHQQLKLGAYVDGQRMWVVSPPDFQVETSHLSGVVLDILPQETGEGQ